MTSLSSVVTNLGDVKPHVRPVAKEIADKFGPLYFIWGAPGRGTGDHAKGLALDFMTYELGEGVDKPGPTRIQLGRDIAEYLLANRVRLNVQYIIYLKTIVSAKSKWKWRPYDGDNPHVDHVHVSFKATGTYKAPTEKEDNTVADETLAYAKEAYADTTEKLNKFEARVMRNFAAIANALKALADNTASPNLRTAVHNALKDVK